MRIKRGKKHLQHRKNILKATKGYRWGRKSKIKLAKTAILKAGAYAFRDRRAKKRISRRVWEVRINAASRSVGTTYSKLIGKLHAAKSNLDRKVLAEMAVKYPAVFAKIAK